MFVHFAALIQRFLRIHLKPPKGASSLNKPLPPALLPSTHQKAAQALVDVSIVNSLPYRERYLRHSREGAHPDIIRFQNAFCKELQRRGFPFFPICFYRGKEEQNAHFKNRTSMARFGQSPHNFGLAVDIVHFGKWWDITKMQWDIIGLIGKETARRLNLKVTWGGDWNFYDPAHWELTDWKDKVDWT